MNHVELDTAISSLETEARTAERQGNYRLVWGKIREIGASFKEVRYPSRPEKDAAWNRFQEIVGRVKDAQAELREQQTTTAAALRGRVERLADQLRGDHASLRWGEIWGEIKALSQELKSARFNTKEERDEAWARFQDIVGDVKIIQETQKRKQHEREIVSESHKKWILHYVHRAHPVTGIISDLIDAGANVIGQFLPGGETDQKKDELQSCSENLHRARQELSEKKGEMLGRDKHEVFEAIKEAQEALNAAWERWREAKSAAHAARQSAWRERIMHRIANLEERLSTLYDKLSKAESHLAELESKRASAWNDSFRDRVDGWIAEAQDRIDGLRGKVREVEGWLDEERGKLR